MKTEVLPAGLLDHEQQGSLERAAELLRAGQLVAFPTDTVYGVGAPVFQPEAVAAIYIAKERPPDKAIPVLVADEADVLNVALPLPESARRLAALWPGALTLVLPKRPEIPPIVSSDATVAVRIPDLDLARALLRLTGPLAATSANRSGQPSPVTAADVLAQLDGRIAAVLDGGPCPGGVPSTVVNCCVEPPVILRQGGLPLAPLRAAWPGIVE